MPTFEFNELNDRTNDFQAATVTVLDGKRKFNIIVSTQEDGTLFVNLSGTDDTKIEVLHSDAFGASELAVRPMHSAWLDKPMPIPHAPQVDQSNAE